MFIINFKFYVVIWLTNFSLHTTFLRIKILELVSTLLQNAEFWMSKIYFMIL